MAIFKCAGRKRLRADGEPYCAYEAPAPWLGRCPVELGGCGRWYDCEKIGAERAASGEATLASLAHEKPKPRISTGISEVDEVLSASPGGLVKGATLMISGEPGGGKCLGRGTSVMKHDGSVVPVEDVRAGDLLMGPDGLSRCVLATNSGRGALRRIVPDSGDPWVCNDVHVMTFVDDISDLVFDVPLDHYLCDYPGPMASDFRLFRVIPGADCGYSGRSQVRRELRMNFKVEVLGEGEYFGFELDGDGRFLLGDFTVTHNTTLLLTIASNVARDGRKVIFASGEQTKEDIGDLARRIGATSDGVVVMGMESDIYKITARAEESKPALIVIDSLQTAIMSDVQSDAGSSYQCKAVADHLTEFGKTHGIAIAIVAQISKTGDLAGPKSAEHLVDVIAELDPLMDEDGEEQDESIKRMRIGKNRHGPSGVSCLLKMTGDGIRPLPPPRRKSRLHTV